MTSASNILYDSSYRYGIYGALYFSLFLFVATLSGIKIYKKEKVKILKRKKAFGKKPGSVRSAAAPIELTEEELITIKQRKQKGFKNGIIKTPTMMETTINSNQSIATIRTITIEQYDHNKIGDDVEYKLAPVDSPSFQTPLTTQTPTNFRFSNSQTTATVSIPVASASPGDVEHTFTDLDLDEFDDYRSKWGYDDDVDDTETTQSTKTCFCSDFCYILCSRNFHINWPKDTWRYRSIYGTVIVYISDYITDLNILILWSIDGYNQYVNDIQPSNGLNMTFMAIMCLSILLFYKIISGIAVWKATGSFSYGMLQFFDLYIFVEVYRSHKIGHKSDRLRWLNNLESVFEASPQVLLQLVFLMQSAQGDQNSDIVLLGLFFSVFKLGNTGINNDAVHVVKDANKVCCGSKFWLRSLFRITELSATEFTYVLIWIIIGEKFLLLVIVVNLIHNTFLYYGGCLSRQIFNIFGHILSLAQLSYTIVEGIPNKFFLRGKLHENDPDYPDDTRSKLQFPYSIFIKRYNMAKKANHARIQKQRRLRELQSKRHKRKNRKTAFGDDGTLSPLMTPTSKYNGDMRMPSVELKLDFSMVSSVSDVDDSRSTMMKDTKKFRNTLSQETVADHSVSQISIDRRSLGPVSAGKLILNPDISTESVSDYEGINLKEIEKYKTSIGDMTALYSYLTWLHHVMILYLNVYLSSQRPQQIMMIQRTVFAQFWLIMIVIHGILWNDNSSYWRSSFHRPVAFNDMRILMIWGVAFVCNIVSMVSFWLMMEHEIINEVKKKEEIQFKTIYDAIYYGRLDAIINQFDATVYLTSTSRDAKSPLYYAAELAQIDIAEWLINKVAVDINVGASQNRTPLYISCRVGCYEIATMLLDETGCKYNEANEAGRTPLYAACREGHYEIVKELLKQPLIDVNALTKHHSCALAAACQHGWTDIVCELLSKPEIEINVLNESDYTPIFIAALGTHSDIVKLLLQRSEIDIDRGAKNDETLFYVSCERGMDEIVRILIEREDYFVDVNKPNKKNYTPLYIASCFGHANIIDILMTIDRTTLNQCDNIGRTPFFVACRKGHADAVFALLKYQDIDIHKKDQDELTPFAASCQGGSVEVVERLMTLVDRSEIIGVDRMKRTPFFMACREGQTAVVERLMLEDNIIDINQADKLARTPLMVGVKRGHDECVDALCRNTKIDINRADYEDRSPLYIAAKCGPSHSGPVQSLMSRSDLLINAKANGGKTALHIACELGHSSIVMLLLDHADIDVNEPDDTGTSPLAIADKKLDNNVYMRMVMISMRERD